MSSNHQCPLDKLQQKHESVPYRCNACKEVGFGSRYWCKQCNNYALHPCCKKHEPTIKLKFYENREFKLAQSQTSNPTEKFCIACGRNIRGIYYKWKGKVGSDTSDSNIYLHPSCATLPTEKPLQVDFNCSYDPKTKREGHHVHKFRQNNKITLHAEDEICRKCCRCRHMHHLNRQVSWSYKLVEDHFLHVACIEEMEIEKWESNKFPTVNASARAEGSSSQGMKLDSEGEIVD